jgi:hypothetical protein
MLASAGLTPCKDVAGLGKLRLEGVVCGRWQVDPALLRCHAWGLWYRVLRYWDWVCRRDPSDPGTRSVLLRVGVPTRVEIGWRGVCAINLRSQLHRPHGCSPELGCGGGVGVGEGVGATPEMWCGAITGCVGLLLLPCCPARYAPWSDVYSWALVICQAVWLVRASPAACRQCSSQVLGPPLGRVGLGYGGAWSLRG